MICKVIRKAKYAGQIISNVKYSDLNVDSARFESRLRRRLQVHTSALNYERLLPLRHRHTYK